MKKLLLLLLTIVSLSSCKVYQVYQISAVNTSEPYKLIDPIHYEDNNCIISYNFWKDEAPHNINLSLSIYNKTDSIISFDLSKSFLTFKDHYSLDYFEGQIIKAKYSVNSFTGKVSITAPEKIEQPIVAIPPHCSKKIDKFYNIDIPPVDYTDQSTKPKRRNPVVYNYNINSSPLVFSNYLTYCVEKGATHHISTEFFAETISNLKPCDFKTKQPFFRNSFEDIYTPRTTPAESYPYKSRSSFFQIIKNK